MRKQKDRGYEVGYGKPPKATQFKKGHSGNSKGRPKGSISLIPQFRPVAQEKVTITVQGRKRRVTMFKAMCIQMMTSGIRGDVRAQRQVINLAALVDAKTAAAKLAQLQDDVNPIVINVTPTDMKL